MTQPSRLKINIIATKPCATKGCAEVFPWSNLRKFCGLCQLKDAPGRPRIDWQWCQVCEDWGNWAVREGVCPDCREETARRVKARVGTVTIVPPLEAVVCRDCKGYKTHESWCGRTVVK